MFRFRKSSPEDAFALIRSNNLEALVNSIETVKIDPHSKDDNGCSLFEAALESGHYEIIKYLAEKEADGKLEQEVVYALLSCKNEKSLRFVVDLAKKEHCPLTDLESYADDALHHSNPAALKVLHSEGVDWKNRYNPKTPLMVLAEKSKYNSTPEEFRACADFFYSIGIDADAEYESRKASDFALSCGSFDLGFFMKEHERYDERARIIKLKEHGLPDPLIDFLKSGDAEKTFAFSDDLPVKNIELCGLRDVYYGEVFIDPAENCNNYGIESDPNSEKSGEYKIKTVELVKYAGGDYYANGLLVWFPDIAQFGTCDTGHGVIYVFKDIPFDRILADLEIYINAQWNPVGGYGLDLIYDHYEPWNVWEFKES